MSGNQSTSIPSASPKKPTEPPSAVEFDPPLACIKRLLKNSLPESTNVGKDASIAFARACGIFIIYVTACANDFAREGKRQTITANDVLAAIKELDFDEFTPEMTSFLENYRQAEKDKKNAKAAAATAKNAHCGGDEDTGVPSLVTETPKRPREDSNENDDASQTNSTPDEPEAKRTKAAENGDAPDHIDNEESSAVKEGSRTS